MKPAERIYIVPAWPGFLFGAAIFLIFAAGYLLEGFGGPAQVLVISLVVAGILALIETNDNLKGITVSSCRSEPVPAGEEAVLEISVTNSSSRERIGLKVRLRTGWRLDGDALIPMIRPGETQTVRLPIPTSRRGAFRVPAIWVSSSLPAGICFAWKAFPDSGHYHVYPPGRNWRGHPSAGGRDGDAGDAGSEDVAGHRPHHPGEPPSRVDWKVFARSGRLLVKALDGRSGARVILAWEDTAFLEGVENRLEQLSHWVGECVRSRRPFLLRLGGREFTEKNLAACRIALAAHPASA